MNAESPSAVQPLQNLLLLATTVTGAAAGAINLVTDDGESQAAAVGKVPEVLDPADPVPLAASVPLVTESGLLLGSLSVFLAMPSGPAGAALAPEKQSALELVAGQAVAVLELQDHVRALANSLATTRRSQELMETFAGRISHELRNPLTSIIGFTELGEMKDAVAADEFSIIGRTSRRMLARVDDMLSFARVSGELRPRQLSLAAVVSEVLEDLAGAVRASGAEIAVTDFPLEADPDQFRVLLQNLIQNALAYSRAGSAPRIAIAAEAAGGELLVHVTDNGKGIPVADRERVTEPLVRLHRPGDPPGTGLGLATCVRIAAAHGGRLDISDNPAGGTRVSLRIPLPAPAAPLPAVDGRLGPPEKR